MGADVSDSQLLGASDNLKSAGLNDKIELLKVSVIGKNQNQESLSILEGLIVYALYYVCGTNTSNIITLFFKRFLTRQQHLYSFSINTEVKACHFKGYLLYLDHFSFISKDHII